MCECLFTFFQGVLGHCTPLSVLFEVLDMLLLFLIGGGLSLLADMLAFPPDIRHLDADDGL